MVEPTRPRRRPSGDRKLQHYFSREFDGSVRLRIPLPPNLTWLVEEAAGDAPLTAWVQRQLFERAMFHIRKRNEVEGCLARNLPDQEDVDAYVDHGHKRGFTRATRQDRDAPVSRKSPFYFTRSRDGSTRFRIRLSPELASLVEEAAGETELMVYIQRVLRNRAHYHIDKRAEVMRNAVPRNVPDLEDVLE
jgi:hypothetical protein